MGTACSRGGGCTRNVIFKNPIPGLSLTARLTRQVFFEYVYFIKKKMQRNGHDPAEGKAMIQPRHEVVTFKCSSKPITIYNA